MAANTNYRRIPKILTLQPEWILAFAVSLAVVWLHFLFLWHAGGLWRDEVNLLNLSSRHSLAAMSKDSFPVLMPLVVRGWMALGLGQNDFELRSLGLLIGLAMPAALWWTAWKIRRAPPLLGLVLLALNTTVIMFGDSLRAYGVGSLAILLTVAAAALFLKCPTWPRAAGLAVLASLSVQVLYQNAIFIMAICFGAWVVCVRQKNGRAALKILAVAILSASSLLPYWSAIVALPNAAVALRGDFEPEQAFISMANAAGFPLEQYFWVWAFLALVVMVCAATVLRRRCSPPPVEIPAGTAWSQVLVALAAAAGVVWFAGSPTTRWWFLPVLTAAIVWCDRRFPIHNLPLTDVAPIGDSPVNRPSHVATDLTLFSGVTLLTAIVAFAGFLWFAALFTEPWYFMPLLALAAACYEIGLPLSGRHARAAVSGFAVATLAGAVYVARGNLSQRFTNVDLIAQRLTAQAAPDDYIIVSPWYCGITFDHYFKGSTEWDTLPPLGDHSLHRYDLVLSQMKTRGALQPVFGKMSTALRSGHRVWIVGAMEIPKAGTPAPAEPPPPPLKHSGWSDGPYDLAWILQTDQFLSDHSLRITRVYYTTNQAVNPYECLTLNVAEGWQNGATNKMNSVPPAFSPQFRGTPLMPRRH
jgi:hypothetical protein